MLRAAQGRDRSPAQASRFGLRRRPTRGRLASTPTWLAMSIAAAAAPACLSDTVINPELPVGGGGAGGEMGPSGEAGGTSPIGPGGSAGVEPPTDLDLPDEGVVVPRPPAAGGADGAEDGGREGMMEPAGMGGGSAGMAGAMEPEPPPGPCSDLDEDGICDEDDGCPRLADDGADSDQDGVPDACDCESSSALDSDGDGLVDECDRCGLGVALALAPLYYFAFDDAPQSQVVLNRGTAIGNGLPVGDLQLGLSGIGDTQSGAARLPPPDNRPFARLAVRNVSAWASTQFTVMGWIRTRKTQDFAIFSYSVAGSRREVALSVREGRFVLHLEGEPLQGPPASVRDGGWHFVAVSWEGAQVDFYLDGAGVGSAVVPAVDPVATPGRDLVLEPGGIFVIGNDQQLNGGFFTPELALVGGIDEFAVFASALGPEDVGEIFRATTCGEVCNGIDDDLDGLVDEGFLGASPSCPAPTCQAILQNRSNFGPGEYFLTEDPNAIVNCAF